MYLLYLDDSGSASNKDEKYLVLGGISILEHDVYWIQEKLNELASKISPNAPDSIEFHASEIFSGRKCPWKDMDKNKRIEIICDVLRILAQRYKNCAAFACAVHKGSYPGEDPMEKAFEDLCSRFDKQLKRLFNVEKNSQKGIIILDKSANETSLQKLARNFRELGTRWGVLNNLVDVPLFIDSKASRMIQLADHIAYAVFRRYNSGNTKYLDLILHRFDAEGAMLHGLAHKQKSNPDCMCPACMCRKALER